MENQNSHLGESPQEHFSEGKEKQEEKKNIAETLAEQFQIGLSQAKKLVKKGLIYATDKSTEKEKKVSDPNTVLKDRESLEIKLDSDFLEKIKGKSDLLSDKILGSLFSRLLGISEGKSEDLFRKSRFFSGREFSEKIDDLLRGKQSSIAILTPSVSELRNNSNKKMDVVFGRKSNEHGVKSKENKNTDTINNELEEKKKENVGAINNRPEVGNISPQNTRYDFKIEENVRADVAVSKKFGISRNKAQQWIDDGRVWIEDIHVVEKSGQILKEKEEIVVLVPDEIERLQKTSSEEIDVILETEDFVVVNKPSGIVTHPDYHHEEDSVLQRVLHHTKGQISDVGAKERQGIVHRLDKDTSGLMVVAKNNKAHEYFVQLFSQRKIEKYYLALLHSTGLPEEGTINSPIGRDSVDRKKMSVSDSPSAKRAVTHFEVVETFENTTLVRAKIETGRTHQIRVHFSSIDHPLVGDPIYGNEKLDGALEKSTKEKIPGLFLHAERLRFSSLDESFEDIAVPLPEKLEEFLGRLRS